jgi:hypothetical protein
MPLRCRKSESGVRADSAFEDVAIRVAHESTLFPNLALRPYASAVAMHDPLDGRQAHAGPFEFARRAEPLKDPEELRGSERYTRQTSMSLTRWVPMIAVISISPPSASKYRRRLDTR